MARRRYTYKDLEEDIAAFNSRMREEGTTRFYVIGSSYGRTELNCRTIEEEDAGFTGIRRLESGTPRECYEAMVSDSGWCIAETLMLRVYDLEKEKRNAT